MISDQIREVEEAARFITRVMSGFNESGLFEEYKRYENFTDEEFADAMEVLSDFGNGTRIERKG